MKAKEAINIANKETNIDLEFVFRKIKKAANRGNYSCSVWTSRINDVEKEKLHSLGYIIKRSSGKYHISWKRY